MNFEIIRNTISILYKSYLTFMVNRDIGIQKDVNLYVSKHIIKYIRC